MEKQRAPLSRIREEITGTVDQNMPFGIPLLEQMDNEALSRYLFGEVTKSKLGLPGSEFISDEPVIAQNLEGLRERTRQTLRLDIAYAQEQGREVPQEVLLFLLES